MTPSGRPPEKPCRRCGKLFTGRTALVYCTPECGVLARKAITRIPLAPGLYTRPCRECSGPFVSRKLNDPFCSDRCMKLSRERRDAKRCARWAVKYALRTGRLVRGGCERAGGDCAGKIEAHHDNYARPLEVRWLCRHHHLAVDQEAAA